MQWDSFQGKEQRRDISQLASSLPPLPPLNSIIRGLAGVEEGIMAPASLAWWQLGHHLQVCSSESQPSAPSLEASTSPTREVQLCSHSHALSFGSFPGCRGIVSFAGEGKLYFSKEIRNNKHFIHLLKDVSLPTGFPIPLIAALVYARLFFFSDGKVHCSF